MDLVSAVIARALAITDSLAGYFAVISGTVAVQNNCFNWTIYNVELTTCGQQFLQFIVWILVDNPLSILGFWFPALQEIIAGMMSI